MKAVSLAVLFLLVLSAVPLVHVSPRSEASVPSLMALDVCAASGSALYASPDFPYMGERTVCFFPESSSVLHEIAELPFPLHLPAVQLERPPRF